MYLKAVCYLPDCPLKQQLRDRDEDIFPKPHFEVDLLMLTREKAQEKSHSDHDAYPIKKDSFLREKSCSHTGTSHRSRDSSTDASPVGIRANPKRFASHPIMRMLQDDTPCRVNDLTTVCTANDQTQIQPVRCSSEEFEPAAERTPCQMAICLDDSQQSDLENEEAMRGCLPSPSSMACPEILSRASSNVSSSSCEESHEDLAQASLGAMAPKSKNERKKSTCSVLPLPFAVSSFSSLHASPLTGTRSQRDSSDNESPKSLRSEAPASAAAASGTFEGVRPNCKMPTLASIGASITRSRSASPASLRRVGSGASSSSPQSNPVPAARHSSAPHRLFDENVGESLSAPSVSQNDHQSCSGSAGGLPSDSSIRLDFRLPELSDPSANVKGESSSRSSFRNSLGKASPVMPRLFDFGMSPASSAGPTSTVPARVSSAPQRLFEDDASEASSAPQETQKERISSDFPGGLLSETFVSVDFGLPERSGSFECVRPKGKSSSRSSFRKALYDFSIGASSSVGPSSPVAPSSPVVARASSAPQRLFEDSDLSESSSAPTVSQRGSLSEASVIVEFGLPERSGSICSNKKQAPGKSAFPSSPQLSPVDHAGGRPSSTCSASTDDLSKTISEFELPSPCCSATTDSGGGLVGMQVDPNNQSCDSSKASSPKVNRLTDNDKGTGLVGVLVDPNNRSSRSSKASSPKVQRFADDVKGGNKRKTNHIRSPPRVDSPGSPRVPVASVPTTSSIPHTAQEVHLCLPPQPRRIRSAAPRCEWH